MSMKNKLLKIIISIIIIIIGFAITFFIFSNINKEEPLPPNIVNSEPKLEVKMYVPS